MKTDTKKTAVIVGCSDQGARLAHSLSNKGYRVIVMDQDYDAFDRLERTFRGTFFLGKGEDLSALRALGVTSVQLFVAATNNDQENIRLSEKAESTYHLKRTLMSLKHTRTHFICHRAYEKRIS